MTLLAGKLYNPTTAATKTMTAAAVMAVIDSTNLRLAFTAPSNGSVLVRMAGTLVGATTLPIFLFGILESTTIKAAMAPAINFAGTISATSLVNVESVFLVTGLTPGAALTWDAAVSVEVAGSAGSVLKWGGANTTANDAWGGFAFEIWTT